MAVDKKRKLYSETMRELSFLDADSLALYQMKWGMCPVDKDLVRKYGHTYYEQIPVATPVRINAMNQVLASMEDSVERREWADRIEGKATQTTMNIEHSTAEGIETLEAYTRDKLDSIFAGMENE